MQPVPESMGKQIPPHQHLGLGILSPDAAHIVTAGGWVVNIGHNPKIGDLQAVFKYATAKLITPLPDLHFTLLFRIFR